MYFMYAYMQCQSKKIAISLAPPPPSNPRNIYEHPPIVSFIKLLIILHIHCTSYMYHMQTKLTLFYLPSSFCFFPFGLE